MPNCEMYREMISESIDSQLTDEQQRTLDEHIALCPSCASLLDLYRGISEAVIDSAQEPPAELLTNVMAQVRAAGPLNQTAASTTRKKRSAGKIVMRYFAAAACVAVVIFAASTAGKLDFLGASSSAPNMAVAEASVENAADDAAVMEESVYDDAEAMEESAEAPAAEVSTTEKSVAADGAAAADPAADEAAIDTPSAADAGIPDQAMMAPAAEYGATVTVSGELPALLEGYEQTDLGDGRFEIVVPMDVAVSLAGEGYSVEYTDDTLENAIVIYTP